MALNIDPNYLLGGLAFMTIGGLIVISLIHFGSLMRDKRNRDTAHNALIAGGSSAHTAVRGGATPEHLKG